MPRDSDKNNDRPRGPRRGPERDGRGVRPGGKPRPPGKPRSRDDAPPRDAAKPRAAKSFAGKPAGKSFGDRAGPSGHSGKRFDDRKSGERPSRPAPYAGDRSRSEGSERAAPARFNRDDRAPRSRDDAPRRSEDRGDRAPRKPFVARDDRAPRADGGEKRPYAGKREFGDRKPYAGKRDAGDRKPYAGKRDFADRNSDTRGPRSAPSRDGDERRPPRPAFRKDDGARSARPPSRGPRPEFGRDRTEQKPWQRDGARPERAERPATARIAGKPDDRKFSRDRPQRDDRPRDRFQKDSSPRGDRPQRDARPRSDRPREDGARAERPRFERPREDRPRQDRPRQDGPRQDRPRQDRPARTAWQEHPRSEATSSDVIADRPARDGENESEIFAKRPAFGGRGPYRDRKPEGDGRREPRVAARPAAPKKSGERIAKQMARAGLCSRRDAEAWITEGRVAVNGRIINSPALDITERDVVTVDGKPLPERERTRLFLYHKPRGLMTTHADPEGRPTVFDNLPQGLPRLISIGRLDFNTEGLLLLTNDGGLARVLELPDTGWLRRYRVRAHGEITQAQLDALRDGVEVDGVKYGAIDATLERDHGANVWLVFAIREGKNREVRNVMAHLGLEVNRLIRVSYGPFQLAEIAEGQVEEVRTRVLRDQLGDKIVAKADAHFALPRDESDGAAEPAAKPRGRNGLIADRKGRRILVQRAGGDDDAPRRDGATPYKRPQRGYHGKRDIKPRTE